MRVLGMTVYSFERMETERTAYRRSAVFPNLAPRASIPARTYSPAQSFVRPALWPPYSSTGRSRSRDSTISGTRPLTSPPYLVISLTRLELRNE